VRSGTVQAKLRFVVTPASVLEDRTCLGASSSGLFFWRLVGVDALEQQSIPRRWSPEPQKERGMTSQKNDPNPARQPYRDLNDQKERTTTDPDRRAEWGMGVTDPPAKSTNPGTRAWWGIGGLLAVILLGAAAISLWNQRSSTSSATGPSTTQSAPSSTGQGGAANTGPAR